MTAALSESITHGRESACPDLGNAVTSASLPDVLRGAAYISSGGRVYRLFSECDTSSMPHSMPVPPILESVASDDASVPEMSASSMKVSLDALEMIEEELEMLTVTAVPTVMPSLSERKKVTPEFSTPHIESWFARPPVSPPKCSVEAATGLSSRSAPQRRVITPPSTPNPTIKLLDILPESVSEPVSIPAQTKQNAKIAETNIKEPEVAQEPTQETSDKNNVQNNPQIKIFRLEIKPGPSFRRSGKLPFSAPVYVDRSQIETKPQIEPIKTSVELPAREAGVWRLAWQPTWPRYLASLERQASNQIQYLADHLEMQFEQGHRVISFNSFRPGDGCTTLSLCAARELAERGHRLLLADAHRQHPELAELLELNLDPQHYEILTLIPNRLELLPWSESFIEVNSHDELFTKSFGEIVADLRDDYDAILLDAGSLIENPIAEHVHFWRQMRSDGVMLVVNTKHLESAEVNRMVKTVTLRLQQNHVALLGVAENYV